MNAFAVLGVPDGCDDDVVIKKAYREQALRWHPDRVDEQERKNAELQMQLINNSYELVRTSEARRLYKAANYASESTGALLLKVPVIVCKTKYSLSNAFGAGRLWRSLTQSGTSGDQKKSAPFQEARISKGKLLLYSQNISLRVSVSIGPALPKIVSEKEFLFEQLVKISASDFDSSPEIIQRLQPFLRDYEPQLDYKLLARTPQSAELDLHEGQLQENQFANSKQFLKQMASMSLDVMFKTTRAVQGVERDNIQISNIVPDVAVRVCDSHPCCPTSGTVLLEMEAAIVEYSYKNVKYVCIANLATGDCIGETEPSWFKKLLGGVAGALK